MTARLLSVGDIAWAVGYDYLIAAYARLHQDGVPFQARIVGTGTLLSEIRFSIRDMGLAHVVTLESAIAPETAIAACDLLVIAAHLDHASIRPALNMAQEKRLPVVMTAFDGHPAAAPGVTIVPRRDVRALTDALTTAIAALEVV